MRGDTFGYLQRSFLGCVSDVDQLEARQAGERAAGFVHDGDGDGSVTLHRTGDGGNYAAEFMISPLEDVAGKTKVMADEFIAKDAPDVTDAFVYYLKPLLGSGMPEAFRLEAERVGKILKK